MIKKVILPKIIHYFIGGPKKKISKIHIKMCFKYIRYLTLVLLNLVVTTRKLKIIICSFGLNFLIIIQNRLS